MANYVTCPGCYGAIQIAGTRGKSRYYCKHCKRWVIVNNGVAVGFA